MAKGFDDLIEFLLREVALCGDQGTLLMKLRDSGRLPVEPAYHSLCRDPERISRSNMRCRQ